MRRARKAEPKYFAGYMHDMRVGGFIVSTCCEGPECEICMMDENAKARADASRKPQQPDKVR